MSKLVNKTFNGLVLSETDFRIRIEDDLFPITDPAEQKEAASLYRACVEKYESGKNVIDDDFSLTYDEVIFRVVAMSSIESDAAMFVLRKLPDEVYDWRQRLRLPDTMLKSILYGMENARAIDNQQSIDRGGLIMVFGETNSGKSTTLNAILHEIALRQSWMLMTLEDPVETQFTQVYKTGAKFVQREMASDQFSLALKSALRANVDVIKVGEIRDRHTAATVIDASLSGHLVLTTLHARSMEDGFIRFAQLIDNNYEVLAQSFRCCLHQTLSKGNTFDTRTMQYQFLGRTKSVVHQMQDGRFRELNQTAKQHTNQMKSGRA